MKSVDLGRQACSQAGDQFTCRGPRQQGPSLNAERFIAPTAALPEPAPKKRGGLLDRVFGVQDGEQLLAWRSGVAFVAFSTLAYVLNHVYRLGNGPMEWLMLACFGVAYATALWRSGTLWGAVGLHWGWNLSNAVLGNVFPIETTSALQAPLLSAAMHLLMAAVIFGATARRRPFRRPVSS